MAKVLLLNNVAGARIGEILDDVAESQRVAGLRAAGGFFVNTSEPFGAGLANLIQEVKNRGGDPSPFVLGAIASMASFLKVIDGFVILANDASASSGVSIEALSGDVIRQRVGGLECYFVDVGPGNVPQFSTPHGAVALRIRGPGWETNLNASLEMLTGSTALHANQGALDLVSYENTIGITFICNMLLERDAPGGATYKRTIKGRSTSSGAVTTDIRTYAPPDGNVFKARASVSVSNNTDNEGGTFGEIAGTFQRVGGVLTQVGATEALEANRLPASIGAAAIAFVVTTPDLILRGTGVANKDMTWSGYLTLEQCPIT